MAEKSSKKEVKPADKKVEGLMDKHPQVLNNARHLFRNENGTTVVQERVPRGDLPQEDVISPRNEFDLTDDDLQGIADSAKKSVDPILAKYDEDVALEDALSKTIWSKDSGKYQGRLSASTQSLILDVMKGGAKPKKDSGKKTEKKASDEPKSSDVKDAAGIDALVNKIPTSMADIAPSTKSTKKNPPKEAGMDKQILQKMADDLSKKLDAIKTLLCDGEEEESEDEKKPVEDKDAGSRKGSGKDSPECPMKEETSIMASLDEIAELVEKEAYDKQDLDLFRIAYQIDCVSDYIGGTAKDAAALQTDPDEDFMRKAFKSGVNEHDADESFMKEFSNDNTKETSRVVGQVSVQHKAASEKLPYAVKKDA